MKHQHGVRAQIASKHNRISVSRKIRASVTFIWSNCKHYLRPRSNPDHSYPLIRSGSGKFSGIRKQDSTLDRNVLGRQTNWRSVGTCGGMSGSWLLTHHRKHNLFFQIETFCNQLSKSTRGDGSTSVRADNMHTHELTRFRVNDEAGCDPDLPWCLAWPRSPCGNTVHGSSLLKKIPILKKLFSENLLKVLPENQTKGQFGNLYKHFLSYKCWLLVRLITGCLIWIGCRRPCWFMVPRVNYEIIFVIYSGLKRALDTRESNSLYPHIFGH